MSILNEFQDSGRQPSGESDERILIPDRGRIPKAGAPEFLKGEGAIPSPLYFEKPFLEGRLLKRYKRFLADVQLEDGTLVTVHCPNTGAMRGLVEPGTEIFLSHQQGTARKYPHTWEAARVEGVMVGVNTMMPNRLIAHCMSHNAIPQLAGYSQVRREAPYEGDSRIDFLLQEAERPDCYVEVKNVHFKEGAVALFPDSPTTRGKKHMEALTRRVKAGCRAVVLYVIQRDDVEAFALAEKFDPAYAQAARQAFDEGVEIYPAVFALEKTSIRLKKFVPFLYI